MMQTAHIMAEDKAFSFPKTTKGADLHDSSDHPGILFWEMSLPNGCCEAKFVLALKVAQAMAN